MARFERRAGNTTTQQAKASAGRSIDPSIQLVRTALVDRDREGCPVNPAMRMRQSQKQAVRACLVWLGDEAYNRIDIIPPARAEAGRRRGMRPPPVARLLQERNRGGFIIGIPTASI